MIWSALRLLVRDIKRHGFYTLVNVFGLAVGIAVCLLVLLFLQREFSFNAYHRDGDRIHQVLRYRVPLTGNPYYSRGIKGSAGPALVAELPEVSAAVRFLIRPMWAGTEDHGFMSQGAIVDPNFLRFFTFPTVTGRTVSEVQPGEIYVTEDFAKKIFGSTDVVGRSVRLNYKWLKGVFQIADVLRNVPDVTSTTLTFDFVVNRQAITTEWVEQAWTTGIHQYLFIRQFVRLAPGVTPEDLREKLNVFAADHLGEGVAEREHYALLPIERLYLYGHRDFPMFNARLDTGDIYQCYAFALVGGFLLLIACINFVNLLTARVEDRALEVGVRKAVGATRVQLAGQFLVETFGLSVCAAVLAVGLVFLSLPWINGLLGFRLEPNLWFWFFCLITAVVAGFGAGTYPAFLLSGFRPALVLKASRHSSLGQSCIRKGLVIGQFAIAVVLIVVTLTVQAQMQYVQTRDMGFRRDGLLILPFYTVKDARLFDQYDVIRERFLALPGVVGYTASDLLPGRTSFGDLMSVVREGQTDTVRVYELAVDHNFTTVYDIAVLEGRGFRVSDFKPHGQETHVLLNQTAARLLGVNVGDRVRLGQKTFQILGIVKDFFYNSLYTPMAPVLMIWWYANYNYVTLDIRTEDWPQVIASLEALWKEYIPNRPFEYEFIDEHLARVYRDDQRTQEAFLALSILTIFVACLGLLGLIAQAVRVRTKEIGVRKVLGASVGQVVFLLVKDFVRLVVVATVIAWPIAYFVARDWLDRFVYRIDLRFDLFLMGGLLALVIALMTVIYQTLKAAQANPADVLRSE